jgi:inhibitor of cysteine peptidase
MRNRIMKAATYVVVIAIALIALQHAVPIRGPVGASEISRFSSYQELKRFVRANTKTASFPRTFFDFSLGRAESASLDASGGAPSAGDYSATNIQVAGVDEADIVKTDGGYIYVVSGNRTIIVKAYPPEDARILSEIEVEGTVIAIFVNGDRLIVFVGGMPYYSVDVRMMLPEGGIGMPYTPYTPTTSVMVYDISDREAPVLQREFSAEGDYVSSRMIGDHVYVIANKPVYEQDGEPNLPRLHIDGEEKEIPAEDIYYCDVYDYFYMYTSIIAINTQDNAEQPVVETILLGASSNLYVSQDNIYLTFPVWGSSTWEFEKTTIHRISIDGNQIGFNATGEVPGMVLNQFSMDEYDGYFRVATTTRGQTSMNHMYILDMENLNIVGRLEDLAKGEIIYSVRFMGERGYVVTFRTVDPLFVIDLSDPSNPTVLGELKITGYSGYLHPYDETHLIGIGREAEEAEDGDFAWFGGVKISLFDVSDFNNPQLIDDYEIGDRGTESPVLWDHRAFLFDRSKNLMVIPVSVAEIDEADYPGGIPSWAYGRPVWQGAYIFRVSPDAGIALQGRITHVDDVADLKDDYYYYSQWSLFAVKRSLYIGEVLYTISDAMIRMNSLEDLAYINKVELPYTTWEPIDYWPDEPAETEPSVSDKGEVEPSPGSGI